jgi:hypothetical protein
MSRLYSTDSARRPGQCTKRLRHVVPMCLAAGIFVNQNSRAGWSDGSPIVVEDATDLVPG